MNIKLSYNQTTISREIVLEDNWKFIDENEDNHLKNIYGVGNRACYSDPNEEIQEGRRAFKVCELINSTLFRIGSFLSVDEVDKLVKEGWEVTLK